MGFADDERDEIETICAQRIARLKNEYWLVSRSWTHTLAGIVAFVAAIWGVREVSFKSAYQAAQKALAEKAGQQALDELKMMHDKAQNEYMPALKKWKEDIEKENIVIPGVLTVDSIAVRRIDLEEGMMIGSHECKTEVDRIGISGWMGGRLLWGIEHGEYEDDNVSLFLNTKGGDDAGTVTIHDDKSFEAKGCFAKLQ